jgi:hypothetical protein
LPNERVGGKISTATPVLWLGIALRAPKKEEQEMSDEIRPEDEVEAHGPYTDAPVTDAPVADATADEEPDVEAHGPLTDAPVTDAPFTEAPVTD